MSLDPLFVGIEIGGTKLQLGVGPGAGMLVGLWRAAVVPSAGAERIRRQIQEAVPELLKRAGIESARIAGVGIGFGGPVNESTRRIVTSHQIADWDNFPLADWLTESLGWPAILANDADMAALAEARFGAGRGLSPIFYVTIGSGVGGGLILNGEIYRGGGHGAAEIGHLLMTERGDSSKARPLEDSVSGWSIARRAREALRDQQDRGSHLRDVPPEDLTALHVAAAAAKDDGLALAVLQESWSSLARALGHVIALLAPRRIIIGGGVSLMGERLLFDPLRKLVAQQVFRPLAGSYDIVPAALGEEVVIHGALALARQKLGPRA